MSVYLFVPNFVPIFFYIIEEVIEVDELDEGNMQQENKIYYGWLSWAVPHLDLFKMTKYTFFVTTDIT